MDGSVGDGLLLRVSPVLTLLGWKGGGDYYVSFWHKEHRM